MPTTLSTRHLHTRASSKIFFNFLLTTINFLRKKKTICFVSNESHKFFLNEFLIYLSRENYTRVEYSLRRRFNTLEVATREKEIDGVKAINDDDTMQTKQQKISESFNILFFVIL